MNSRERALQSLRDFSRRHRVEIEQATLGNGAGVVEVPARTGWVYVRIRGGAGNVIQAKNDNVAMPLDQGIIVDIEVTQRTGSTHYRVLGPSATLPNESSSLLNLLRAHHTQHERIEGSENGGSDPVDVIGRMIVPLRATPQDPANFTVYVNPGYYNARGTLRHFAGGNSPTFTVPPGSAYKPGWRTDALYIGTDFALHIIQGTVSYDPNVLLDPTVPNHCIPICKVILKDTTTAITEEEIRELRPFVSSLEEDIIVDYQLVGDVRGTLTGNRVMNLQGRAFSSGAPANNDVIVYKTATSRWEPGTVPSPVTFLEEDGAPNVPGVTGVKVPNGSLTNNGANQISLDFGPKTFLALDDTPNSYTGLSGYFVRVKEAENGLEFAGSAGGGHIIQDEGSSLTARTYLNFVGSIVTVTDDPDSDATIVTLTGGGSGHTIQDEGTPLADRAALNFIGAGVAVTDDSGNNRTNVTISAVTDAAVQAAGRLIALRSFR